MAMLKIGMRGWPVPEMTADVQALGVQPVSFLIA